VIAGDTGKHLCLAVAPTFHKPDMFGRWPADRRQGKIARARTFVLGSVRAKRRSRSQSLCAFVDRLIGKKLSRLMFDITAWMSVSRSSSRILTRVTFVLRNASHLNEAAGRFANRSTSPPFNFSVLAGTTANAGSVCHSCQLPLGRPSILGKSAGDGRFSLVLEPERRAISVVNRSAASGDICAKMSDIFRGFIWATRST